MKNKIIFSFSCAMLCAFSGLSQDVIELPMTIKNGSVLGVQFGGVAPYDSSPDDPWRVTHLYAKGVPTVWSDVKVGDIDLDIYQTVYQNYLQGNMPLEFYKKLQQTWVWPDTLALSKCPIKSQVAFAFGKDVSGKTMMIIDANNNLDFSDDVAFEPIELGDGNYFGKDLLYMKHSIEISYERLFNGEIVQRKVPMLVGYVTEHNMFASAFCNML